jgi:hypothetical protein
LAHLENIEGAIKMDNPEKLFFLYNMFFMSKLYDLQCNFIVKIFYKQTLLKLTLCHAKYLLFF